MDDDFDGYDADIDYSTRDEEKAAEIALDLANEQRHAKGEEANPRPGHTEMCEGCHGSGGGYEDEVWDYEAQEVVFIDHEHCPECGGCGFYDCDGTCEFAQDPDES
ncbi:hypothetical protein ACFC1R_08370 [Kitasatospora sp. NPDC056138]|uniref:hypothetical protein n=1 Tax=Kitasatospora sp. NPDC056138 TaxID=3345724 RepID=UPI0035DB8A4B